MVCFESGMVIQWLTLSLHNIYRLAGIFSVCIWVLSKLSCFLPQSKYMHGIGESLQLSMNWPYVWMWVWMVVCITALALWWLGSLSRLSCHPSCDRWDGLQPPRDPELNMHVDDWCVLLHMKSCILYNKCWLCSEISKWTSKQIHSGQKDLDEVLKLKNL